MKMSPDFVDESFRLGIEGGGERGLAGVFRIVREGLGEIAACALEPLLPADVPPDRK